MAIVNPKKPRTKWRLDGVWTNPWPWIIPGLTRGYVLTWTNVSKAEDNAKRVIKPWPLSSLGPNTGVVWVWENSWYERDPDQHKKCCVPGQNPDHEEAQGWIKMKFGPEPISEHYNAWAQKDGICPQEYATNERGPGQSTRVLWLGHSLTLREPRPKWIIVKAWPDIHPRRSPGPKQEKRWAWVNPWTWKYLEPKRFDIRAWDNFTNEEALVKPQKICLEQTLSLEMPGPKARRHVGLGSHLNQKNPRPKVIAMRAWASPWN